VPSGILTTLTADVQHALGIHDFYRYGLWGFCEGYNVTVVACTDPKPGNGTNPIAAINDEFTKDLHIPLPNDVEKDVHRLQSASLFIFSCWVVGIVLGFSAALSGVLLGCRSGKTACGVGLLAFVSLSNHFGLSNCCLAFLCIHLNRRFVVSDLVFSAARCNEYRRLRYPQYSHDSRNTDVRIRMDKLYC
jgi:SUR7/PalI family